MSKLMTIFYLVQALNHLHKKAPRKALIFQPTNMDIFSSLRQRMDSENPHNDGKRF